jgi:hypothetical protein
MSDLTIPNMAEIRRTVAYGKLNSLTYKAMKAATALCKKRGNPYLELVHWVHQILQNPDSDLRRRNGGNAVGNPRGRRVVPLPLRLIL